MANTNSLTIGNTTLPVANSLASLNDTNVPSDAADGSLLFKQNDKWSAVPVATAIGGNPAFVLSDTERVEIASAQNQGFQIRCYMPDTTKYSTAFFNADKKIRLYTAAPNASFQNVATFSADEDTGWLNFTSEYLDFTYQKKNGIVCISINNPLKKEVPAVSSLKLGVIPEGYRPRQGVSGNCVSSLVSVRNSNAARGFFVHYKGDIYMDIGGVQSGTIVGGMSYPAA